MPIKDDLGLPTQLGAGKIDQPWMSSPDVRTQRPVGGYDADNLTRALSEFTSGVSSMVGKRNAEKQALKNKQDAAAGRLAGHDPKAFDAAVARGEKYSTDSPYFLQGRSEGAADADSSLLHASVSAKLTPNMSAEDLQAMVQGEHDRLAGDRGKGDPVYAAAMAESANKAHEQLAVQLSGMHRQLNEEDGKLQARRNWAQRGNDWLKAGMPGGVGQLKADLEAVDQHYAVTGLSASDRAGILNDTLKGLMVNSGNTAFADAGDLTVHGGGPLADITGGDLKNTRRTMEKQAASDYRSDLAEARAARTESKQNNESEFVKFVTENPATPLPADLRARTLEANPGLVLGYAASNDKSLAAIEIDSPEVVKSLVDSTIAGKPGFDSASIIAKRGSMSNDLNSKLLKIAGGNEKDGGGITKRSDYNAAISTLRAAIADEKAIASKMPMMPGAAKALEASSAELELQATQALTSEFQDWLNSDPANKPTPEQAQKWLSTKVTEKFNFMKIARESAKARVGAAKMKGATPDTLRDMRAAQELASSGPGAYVAYKSLQLAEAKPVGPEIEAALSAWSVEGGKKQTPAGVATWNAYKAKYGTDISYGAFLKAVLMLSLPAEAFSAPPEETQSAP